MKAESENVYMPVATACTYANARTLEHAHTHARIHARSLAHTHPHVRAHTYNPE